MKASLKSPIKSKYNNELRIIGGRWRGRKFRFAEVEGLRPTGDRIRETLFNWLAPELEGARCLDLFSGSGALGLEALSRGALACLLCERDPKAAALLRQNLQLLSASNGEVKEGDCLSMLGRGNSGPLYQVAFIDPPFHLKLWQACIDALEAGGWLTDMASIYIESGLNIPYEVPTNWVLHRDKRAGQVSYRLYYREAP